MEVIDYCARSVCRLLLRVKGRSTVDTGLWEEGRRGAPTSTRGPAGNTMCSVPRAEASGQVRSPLLFHTDSSIVQSPPQAIFPPLPYSKNALHQQLCSVSGPHCTSTQTDLRPTTAAYLVAMKRWPKPFAKAFEFFRSLWYQYTEVISAACTLCNSFTKDQATFVGKCWQDHVFHHVFGPMF